MKVDLPIAAETGDRLLRPREVAEILGIGLTTLMHLCQERELIPLRVGRGRGVKRYTPSSIRAYIRALEDAGPNTRDRGKRGRPRGGDK